ncbi:TipC family immunity protein [Streptococcus ruminantium]|uniref:TipC family immunity protein n=1 Tax=Streptococcus ruminantium TaxID=1917441 RepID=A0ABU1B644_9STRE|nr:TipC family immunity protein [Streptococcus ruminantium]MDQ8760305.1 TipC family immunity protein [Streptococcus ruminantium]MDQ8769972.1 TipC family immunity protein [Streptococcus ruminantium]MDQ8775217.1 TipC family immunity protein [Streptococcus ruminantium]MDQ8794392.1 TipC family immunity protein [Streptococcus ruminantium]MDQ8796962.1 TipC family immunity protein [Streptococcus ruminantium]
MNKKMIYTLSVVVFVIALLPLVLTFFKPRHSNIFEEIYHDEYHHATTSFLRTNSTLNKIPDMEKKNTRGLLFGTTVESYKESTLPKDIDSINYTFNYPDDELEKGSVSVFINLNLPTSDILQIEYKYQHHSNQLIQKIRVFSKTFEKEYSVEQYITQRKLNMGLYNNIASDILKSKLISDWISVYPSQFSVENWGNVKIVKDNVLD